MLVNLQIVPLDATVADRWFYFPMVGLLGLLALAAQVLINFHRKLGKISLFFVIIILVTLSIRTMVRNANWRDEVTLYSHDIKTTQGNFQLENMLGNVLLSNNHYQQAITHYKNAIKLYPNDISYSDIGAAYDQMGDKHKALYYYKKSLTEPSLYQGINENPDFMIYENLAKYYFRNQQFAVTESFTKKSLKEFPYDGTLWMMFAISEYKQGLKKSALNAAIKAYSLEPLPAYNDDIYKISNNMPIDIN